MHPQTDTNSNNIKNDIYLWYLEMFMKKLTNMLNFHVNVRAADYSKQADNRQLW